MSTITVLLSAYHRTDPQQLEEALASVAQQTRPADDVVVVFDGPVAQGVEEVVEKYGVRTVKCPVNRGTGPALQAGLETVTTDYVAQLDTDDKAFPQRLEVQEAFLDQHPEIAVVGTAVQEFGEGGLGQVRRLPENPARYAKINSPLNHPSVMYRREAVVDVGGYQDVHLMEDYDLWARLLAAGYQLRNLQEPLTYFRVSDAQFARRTGSGMFASEVDMQARLVRYGLIGRSRALCNLALRSVYRALPTSVLKRVYALLFHRKR